MLDEARRSDAARERTRRRWLAHQAAADATLLGVLADAGDHGDTVSITTTAGRAHVGRVAAMAVDAVVVRTAAGHEVWIRGDAIATVRPDATRRAGVGDTDRHAVTATGLAQALADRAADHPRVALAALGGGPPVSGRLHAVGTDVATLHLDGGKGVVYVSLASAVEVSFLGSG